LPYITFASTGVSAGARSTFEPLGYNGDAQTSPTFSSSSGTSLKIHGNHTLKMGVDAREYRWSAYNFGNPSGAYGFNSSWTKQPRREQLLVPVGTRLGRVMLGLPSSGSLDVNTQSTAQAKYSGVFRQ